MKLSINLRKQTGKTVTFKQITDSVFQISHDIDYGDLLYFATKTDAMRMIEFCEKIVRRESYGDFLKSNQAKSGECCDKWKDGEIVTYHNEHD